MLARGPIAQPGSELPAHNRLVPGSNPGGPIPLQSGRTDSDNAVALTFVRRCMNRFVLNGGRIA
jgi:hypothetical protein